MKDAGLVCMLFHWAVQLLTGCWHLWLLFPGRMERMAERITNYTRWTCVKRVVSIRSGIENGCKTLSNCLISRLHVCSTMEAMQWCINIWEEGTPWGDNGSSESNSHLLLVWWGVERERTKLRSWKSGQRQNGLYGGLHVYQEQSYMRWLIITGRRNQIFCKSCRVSSYWDSWCSGWNVEFQGDA